MVVEAREAGNDVEIGRLGTDDGLDMVSSVLHSLDRNASRILRINR